MPEQPPASSSAAALMPRSYLFAPGDQPRLLAKSLEAGADAVVFDLEDAVAPSAKAVARDHVVTALADHVATVATNGDASDAVGRPEVWVRINVPTGDDWLRGTMPVDARTVQPYGILHGGASVALAETLGSVAGNLCVDTSKEMVVGLEINANHVRAMRGGRVTGTARALHVGRSTQLWEIRIENDEGKLVCVSRLTLAVVPLPKP